MSSEIERIKTGIPGLDKLLQGGFITNSSVVVSGGVGAGKTIFCLQSLWAGAKKYGEPGILVTMDETPSELRKEASLFGWDLQALEEENLLAIIDVTPRTGLPSDERYALRKFDLHKLVQMIYNTQKEVNAQRVVIDSLSSLGFRYDESISIIRSTIFQLTAFLNQLEVTTLLTAEVLENSAMARYGVEEFLAQGVIQLFLKDDKTGTLQRSLIIRKMRATPHSLSRYFFEISDDGIVIFL